MNLQKITNIITIFGIVIIILYIQYYSTNLNTDIQKLKQNIELREKQNDSISLKLDSIAAKKAGVINNIDNRTTNINNLYDALDNKPVFDTSISNAVFYLREFSNKKY
jgi:hypothetical protein